MIDLMVGLTPLRIILEVQENSFTRMDVELGIDNDNLNSMYVVKQICNDYLTVVPVGVSIDNTVIFDKI